jgi:ribosomal protein S6--L-glutamate ligase
MAAAEAVILNQGCYESLYKMARRHCRRVFPDYRARFDHPGKIGQTRLFRNIGVNHPETAAYRDLSEFRRQDAPPVRFPAVFKFDWGGEGSTVYLMNGADDLARCLSRAERFERTGQSGFVIQDHVPHGGRTLRVVVVHRRCVAYWRVQADRNRFGTSVADGAHIDRDSDPRLREIGIHRVTAFCRATGINLAGFDLLFHERGPQTEPLFIEINYYFGRRGLGGSEAYYRLLGAAVSDWLGEEGLSIG